MAKKKRNKIKNNIKNNVENNNINNDDFIEIQGHKIEKQLLNDMYVYDDSLRMKDSSHKYGTTVNDYIKGLGKGLDQNDLKQGFYNHYSTVSKLGYQDNNFLDKYGSKIEEANSIIDKTKSIEYPYQKKFEPNFLYNKRLGEYKQTKLELQNQYNDIMDSIVPDYRNYKDAELTPKQEFAKQYIDMNQEEIMKRNIDAYEKSGIGNDYDERKMLVEFSKPDEYYSFEEKVKKPLQTKKVYTGYLDHIANELEETYDLDNLVKSKDGQYSLNFNKGYLEQNLSEIEKTLTEYRDNKTNNIPNNVDNNVSNNNFFNKIKDTVNSKIRNKQIAKELTNTLKGEIEETNTNKNYSNPLELTVDNSNNEINLDNIVKKAKKDFYDSEIKKVENENPDYSLSEEKAKKLKNSKIENYENPFINKNIKTDFSITQPDIVGKNAVIKYPTKIDGTHKTKEEIEYDNVISDILDGKVKYEDTVLGKRHAETLKRKTELENQYINDKKNGINDIINSLRNITENKESQQKEGIQNIVDTLSNIGIVKENKTNEAIKNAKEFEKEILSNSEEIEPTIVEEKIEPIIQNKDIETVVDNSGTVVEKDDSVVVDNSGTVIEKDEPIVSNETDEIVSSDNNEAIEEKIQDINNENKSNVIETKPNETIVTTGSDDTVTTDINGENVVTNNQEETITTNNNYDDLENVVVEKTISDDGKETVKITGNPTKNNTKKFNYGKNGENTTTVDDIVKNIYGNQANGDSAKKFVINKLNNTKGGKEYLKDKEIFDDNYIHGNLKVDKNNKSLGQAVGSVLADKNYSKIVDSNGNINSSKITEIADQYKEFGGLDNVDTGIEKQVRRTLFQKEYDKVGAKFLDHSKNLNQEEENIKDILKKIEKNERLTDPKEIEAFKHYQESIQKLRDEMIEFAEKLGYTAESVFGEGFNYTTSERKNKKNNKKNLKNFNDIIGETDDDGNTRALNFNRKSFNNVNNKDKWLDYNMNDDGKFTKHSVEAKDKMKDDLKEVFEAKDQDFYKAKEEFDKNKTNYLDYLEKNQNDLSDDAKKLYRLQQKGVDIGDDGRQVLQGLAIAHSGGLKGDNAAVEKLNTAVGTLSAEGYMNISDENIDRVGKSGDLIYENGKYKLRDLNLSETQKDQYKDVINSKNVGRANLKDVLDAEKIKNVMDEKNINDETFNKTVKERFDSLKNSNKSTGYNIKEQLVNVGIDEKIAEEIYNQKNNKTNNLSTDAKIALVNMDGTIDQNTADFGRLSADKMKEMVKKNKTFFGADGDVDNMSEDTLRGLFGKAFENTVDGDKNGKLSAGYKFKVKGKDVTTAEGFTEFYNSILSEDGKGLNWDAVFKSVGATEEGKEKFQDVFDWLDKGNDYKDFKKMNIASGVKDYLVNMFEKADENIEGLDKKTIEQIKSHAAALKNTKMDDVAKKVDVDSITSEIGKFSKIGKETSGVVDKLKLGGKAKTIGYAAAGIAALGGLGMMASNAAEERERKRQEMQQLMMAQNQTIRGGY